MRALVTSLAITAAAGCGGALQDAVRLHNATRTAIVTADALAAPWVRAEVEAAQQAHPEDDAAYERALADALAVRDALRAARLAEQRLHLSLTLWEQGDEGAWPEAAACAAEALQDAAEALQDAGVGTGAEAGALDAAAALLAADVPRECPGGAP